MLHFILSHTIRYQLLLYDTAAIQCISFTHTNTCIRANTYQSSKSGGGRAKTVFPGLAGFGIEGGGISSIGGGPGMVSSSSLPHRAEAPCLCNVGTDSIGGGPGGRGIVMLRGGGNFLAA